MKKTIIPQYPDAMFFEDFFQETPPVPPEQYTSYGREFFKQQKEDKVCTENINIVVEDLKETTKITTDYFIELIKNRNTEEEQTAILEKIKKNIFLFFEGIKHLRTEQGKCEYKQIVEEENKKLEILEKSLDSLLERTKKTLSDI